MSCYETTELCCCATLYCDTYNLNSLKRLGLEATVNVIVRHVQQYNMYKLHSQRSKP
jgi:hypothetical protein